MNLFLSPGTSGTVKVRSTTARSRSYEDRDSDRVDVDLVLR